MSGQIFGMDIVVSEKLRADIAFALVTEGQCAVLTTIGEIKLIPRDELYPPTETDASQ